MLYDNMLPREKFGLAQTRLLILLGALCVAILLPTGAKGSTNSITINLQATVNPAVTGYYIYYGTASGDYTNKISVGNVTNVNVSGLVPSLTYYFAATSHDSRNQESSFSSEASYFVPLPITNEPPFISAMRYTTTAFAGQDVLFAVRAIGNSPVFYQWVYNDAALASATNPILVLSNVAPAQSGAYYVNVSDSTGTTNSSVINLTVYPPSSTIAQTTSDQGNPVMQVFGLTNYPYVVQASTDLVSWVSVATNLSPFTFVDSNAGGFPYRFYRSSFNLNLPANSTNDSDGNLVAWYPLAGNLSDYTLNANDGIGVGTIVYTNGPLNATNTALAFDGTDTYVYANNISDFITNSAGITLCGWVHPNDLNTSYAGFGLRSPTDNPGAFYVNLLSNGQYQGRYRNDFGDAVDLGGSFSTNVWTFVALTYDGSTLTLYSNGTAISSAPARSHFAVGGLPLYIGGVGYTPTGSLPNFPMAGIRLYNIALSPAAIGQLYTNGIVNGNF